MSCQNVEDVCQHCQRCQRCQHCLKKLESIDLPKKPISCKHLEDVCEKCLEKVQTSTEEEEEEDPNPPMTAGQKRNKILFNSAILLAAGYSATITAELLLKFFDLSLKASINILKTIGSLKE